MDALIGALPRIEDLDLSNRDGRPCRVFVRADYNVPLEDGQITDDHRISATLPTLERLGPEVVVIIGAHLGRPKGKHVAELSLAPVARHLKNLTGRPVTLAKDVGGSDSLQRVAEAGSGDVVMLENLRFEAGEEGNDPQFALALASLADVYVNEGFGVSHRAHASTVGVAHLLPGAAGLLCRQEVEILGGLLNNPRRPFVAVLGGAKVSDKIGVVSALLDKVDALVIGGGMSFSFLGAQGVEVGDSLVEPEAFETVREALKKAENAGKEIYLPTDVVIADDFAESAAHKVVEAGSISPGWRGLDIGPETVRRYGSVLAGAGSILWNGPMGVFEWPAFEAGTLGIAEAIADSAGYSVVGGGDSGAALAKFGLADQVDYLSTGGGASLEFIEFGDLPGLRALREGVTSG